MLDIAHPVKFLIQQDPLIIMQGKSRVLKVLAATFALAALWLAWPDGGDGKRDPEWGGSGRRTDMREQVRKRFRSRSASPSPLETELGRAEELARIMSDADDAGGLQVAYCERLKFHSDLRARTPPEEMARFMEACLHSDIDVESGLCFGVADGGSFYAVTSIRVSLLDKVLQLDFEAALSLSREVIQRRGNHKEYVVALRNLAKICSHAVARAEIDNAFAAMASERSWVEAPSDGFLEAFDIAVGRVSPGTAGQVLSLGKHNGVVESQVEKSLEMAATLALDRITQKAPDVLLGHLGSTGQDIAWLPAAYRQAMMKRVDIATEVGRSALGDYLGNPAVSDSEKEVSLSVCPTGSYFARARLVSGAELNSPLNIYRTYEQSYATALAMKAAGEHSGDHAEKLIISIGKYFPSDESWRILPELRTSPASLCKAPPTASACTSAKTPSRTPSATTPPNRSDT